MARRVLLVLPTRTYRAGAFLEAARRLGVETVVASDEGSTLSYLHPERELVIDLEDPAAAARAVAERASGWPIDAVVPVDGGAVVGAVGATRNKLALRERMGEARVVEMRWWLWPGGEPPGPVDFPAVVKPLDQ